MERNHSSQVANWREYRRFQAWELYQKGWKQKDIAVALGVTKGSISQWVKQLEQEVWQGATVNPQYATAADPGQRAHSGAGGG